MRPTNPCPLCQGKKFSKIGDFLARQIARCQKCGLVQINPQPKREEIKSLYGPKYFQDFYPYIKAQEIHRSYFRRKVNQIKKMIPQGVLLDIGCATGVFLKEAKRAGFKVRGLDISRFAVNYCKERGLDVDLGTLGEICYKERSFDIVSMFQLIEHTPEPLSFLKEVFWILKPGGLVVLTTPNYDCFTRKLMGKLWFGYRHREHLFFFEKKTLVALFKRAGFKKVKIKRDDLRTFPLSYYLKRFKDYYPSFPLMKSFPLLNFLFGRLPILTDPWGDIICWARK